MNRFQKWAQREYSARQRLTAMFFEGILFVLIFPYLLIKGGIALDRSLGLPRLFFGLPSQIIGGLLVATGGFFALWSIYAQFTRGRGTPVPVMATQELIADGPFAYCRNPMSLGTYAVCLGVAVWIGSLSAAGIVLLFALLLTGYLLFIEEKELAARFGQAYLDYKRRTPFLIPRRPKDGVGRTGG